MNYDDQIKKELLTTNRILAFDRRHWDRREKSQLISSNETEQAMMLIQTETYAFLRGIRSSIKEENLRAAGSLLRSLLESTANAQWILEDKSGNRASKYVAVTDNYTEYLNSVKTNNLTRIPESVRKWTTSSAEDRINAFSPQAGMAWDYCSAFTHPSPTYMSLHLGLAQVLNYVIGQANTYAFTSRYLILHMAGMYNKTESKFLDKMAVEILISKTPNGMIAIA